MVKLADTLDLGSSAIACRFKSCHPYQRNAMLCIAFFRYHETQRCCTVGGSSSSRGFAEYFVLGSPFARGHPYQRNAMLGIALSL